MPNVDLSKLHFMSGIDTDIGPFKVRLAAGTIISDGQICMPP
jgi:hypothetical protein